MKQEQDSPRAFETVRTVAVVGNGPVSWLDSFRIDRCDVVIRFNEWKNYRRHGGRRADVLCICNTGAPARKFIERNLIGGAPFIERISEVWFPRDEEVHKRHASVFDPDAPASEFEDLSEGLVSSNRLSGKRLIHFSGAFNQAVFDSLSRRAVGPFLCPSTGILAIEYVLCNPRFAGSRKFVFGFSHQGWDGHPWQAERALLDERRATRTDLELIRRRQIFPLRRRKGGR